MGTWLAWDFKMSDLSSLPFEGFAGRWLDITGQQQGLILTGAVFTLLFLPKILAVLGALFVPRVRKSFGGVVPLLAGVSLETVISILLAPCAMMAHSLMVAGIISGRAVGWGNQSRETDGTAWWDACRFHAVPTLAGIGWSVLAWHIGKDFALWMAPILLGLALCIPVSVWTSRARYGRALARHRILATPEEISPPAVLVLADSAAVSGRTTLNATTPGREGVVAAVVDPYVNGVHVSLLEHAEMNPVEEALARRCLKDGPDALSKAELSQLLYLAPAMLFMHRTVWLGPGEGLGEMWLRAVESYRRRGDTAGD